MIALLEGASTAHLATIMPDGSPQSVPVWVGMEAGQLAIQTSPGSRKARNIARDPRVASSVTLPQQPFTMAAIRGPVFDRLEGDDAWLVIDRLSMKYTGSPYPRRSDRIVFLIDAGHVEQRGLLRTLERSSRPAGAAERAMHRFRRGRTGHPVPTCGPALPRHRLLALTRVEC